MAGTRILERARVVAIAVGATAVAAVILWLDVTSQVWQELVVLSGLAAGFVTFLLTVFVLDRVLARSAARRWAPVNRLAYTEFLHALADEERSELSRGHVVLRALPRPAHTGSDAEYEGELQRLRELVVAEHRVLADLLSRWAQFLASSGENERILLHVADIALGLDRIRDAALDAEAAREETARRALDDEIGACNGRVRALADELRAGLGAERVPAGRSG
ncbi:hypothetical protein JD276_03055 [Leucobacter sp. CSA1]|uniref:Uncharacterized protein n=1 Tax=Leucobacter chromiisoli TaxID=2796471 RepID=A0A934Q5H2_9MICO|nr:hypothetical protein [Leucobacter chromiisoli]MBK0418013.1 hypothetical protein [Leucobacter chromiisoli]